MKREDARSSIVPCQIVPAPSQHISGRGIKIIEHTLKRGTYLLHCGKEMSPAYKQTPYPGGQRPMIKKHCF